MTAQEAKVQVLCTCYTLRELKAKHEELLAGRQPQVPCRLIDTARLEEVARAIREYDSDGFREARNYVAMSRKHCRLVMAHLERDRSFGRALERGIRSLCVRESRETLQKLRDGIQPESRDCYPWHMAEDATAEELDCAIALYDDRLYRHLRDLAEKTDLDRILSWCCSGDLAWRKERLLAGEDTRKIDVEPFWTASVELLDKALAKCGEPRYDAVRCRVWRQCVRFERGESYYFITDGSDVGTFIAGLVDPDTMIPLLGMVCLEEADPRQVARFFVSKFHFGVIAGNELAENVAFVQHMFSGLTDLVPDFSCGDAHEFFWVDVRAVKELFSDKDMADMARSIDWKRCARRLFS